MNKLLVTSFLLCASLSAVAAEQPKTPTLSPTLVLNYFRSRALADEAQIQRESAQRNLEDRTRELQSVIEELKNACGKDFEPFMPNPNADPVCRPKTPAPTAPVPALPAKK